MIRASDEFRQHIADGAVLLAVVQVFNPGALMVEVPVSSGAVTADRTRDVRYEADLTFVNAEGELTGLFSPYRTRMRLLVGYVYPDGRRELIPAGALRVQDVQPSLGGQVLQVSGFGFEQYVIDDAFFVASNVPGGSAVQALSALIRTSLPPGLPLDIDVRCPDVYVGQTVFDTTRWGGDQGACQMLARSLASEVYCDATGTFVIRPTPGMTDTLTGVSAGGDTGTLVDTGQGAVTRDLSRDAVYNVVVVSSSRTDGTNTGDLYAVVWDADPASPTYMGEDPYGRPAGAFGRSVLHYSTPLPTDYAGAEATARSLLADSRGLVTKTSATVLPDPTIEPGDVRLVQTELGLERQIVDSWSLSLDGSAMSLTCRSTHIAS